jgi:hypothetical protein
LCFPRTNYTRAQFKFVPTLLEQRDMSRLADSCVMGSVFQTHIGTPHGGHPIASDNACYRKPI